VNRLGALAGLGLALPLLVPIAACQAQVREETTMFTGTLRFIDIETGVWQLVTPQGKYQLRFKNRPADLKSLDGKTVQVRGTVRGDLLTTTMAGTVLEVESLLGTA
jgi:hypothetical protein